jgi:type IV pilus assembly protein PilE
MSTSVTFRRNRALLTGRAAGFTLVELMVVITIATILTVIAVPAYTSQMRKSRRTEAKTALLDLAGREERYMATNGVYTSAGTALGYPVDTWTTTTTSSGNYNIAVSNVVAATAGTATTSGTAATFLITATVATGKPQAKDTQCSAFTIDNTGNQLSYNSTSTLTTSTLTTGCW